MRQATRKKTIAMERKAKGSAGKRLQNVPFRTLLIKEDRQCVICLKQFKAEDDVVSLACDHVYHVECMADFLSSGHKHCP